jgi:hypothetical protein
MEEKRPMMLYDIVVWCGIIAHYNAIRVIAPESEIYLADEADTKLFNQKFES